MSNNINWRAAIEVCNPPTENEIEQSKASCQRGLIAPWIMVVIHIIFISELWLISSETSSGGNLAVFVVSTILLTCFCTIFSLSTFGVSVAYTLFGAGALWALPDFTDNFPAIILLASFTLTLFVQRIAHLNELKEGLNEVTDIDALGSVKLLLLDSKTTEAYTRYLGLMSRPLVLEEVKELEKVVGREVKMQRQQALEQDIYGSKR